MLILSFVRSIDPPEYNRGIIRSVTFAEARYTDAKAPTWRLEHPQETYLMKRRHIPKI